MRYKSIEESHNAHLERYQKNRDGKVISINDDRNSVRIKFFVDRVNENSHVLDVGCNQGTISYPLKEIKHCRVKGIDIVPGLVEIAKKRGIFAQVGLAEELPFKDNTFDHVVCGEVIEHLFDPIIAINEAYRVLKQNGSYLITVPFDEYELGDFHHQRFTQEILEKIIKSSKFCNGKITMFGIASGDSIRDDITIPRFLGCEVFKNA